MPRYIPDLGAEIVPEPEHMELLDKNGAAHDIWEYLDAKLWDIEQVVGAKKAVYVEETRRYTFRFAVKWADSWHSEQLISQLREVGFIPTKVSTTSRTNAEMNFQEFRCCWGTGHELFYNMSPHLQRLVRRDYG